jgi:ferredoxin
MEDFVERKFGDLSVRIDRTQCIGTSNCISIAPEVFELDDEGVVSFKEKDTDIRRDRLTEACSVCPVDALFVIDASGKQLVP